MWLLLQLIRILVNYLRSRKQALDGADTEEDLVQKLEEAGEKEFIAQVVNPELEHV